MTTNITREKVNQLAETSRAFLENIVDLCHESPEIGETLTASFDEGKEAKFRKLLDDSTGSLADIIDTGIRKKFGLQNPKTDLKELARSARLIMAMNMLAEAIENTGAVQQKIVDRLPASAIQTQAAQAYEDVQMSHMATLVKRKLGAAL